MTDARFDVLAIGHAIVDVLARCDDAFIARRGLAKGAMRLVDQGQAARLQQAMGAMGPATQTSGGSAANTAAGVAALGGRACFVGRVADDALGRAFARDIRAQGVAFATPAASDGPATGRSLVLVTPDGERTMNTHLGAAAGLAGGDLDPDDIAAAGTVYLEGYLWDAPCGPALFETARRMARQASREVALTLSDPLCVERHRDAFLAFIRAGVDIVFANEDEAIALTRTGSIAAAATAMAEEVRLAVITRSEKGCLIARGSERIAIEAVATEVVDTTGAGDLHAAGFLYGHAQGAGLERAGRIAAICAAEVIGRIGARPRADLRALVADGLG